MAMNLALPGNPRYQPQELVSMWGYDNLMRSHVEVELAALDTLDAFSKIPAGDYRLLTYETRQSLLAITTTEVDEMEKKTKHDIRALVRCMQERMPEPLRRFVHVPLTSYDVIETARALQFRRAHFQVIEPKIKQVVAALSEQAKRHASTRQIGRTHGQHALPITAGFWLAGLLSRILECSRALTDCALNLNGKISGAVGAHNAQIGLGMSGTAGASFESAVLSRLNLLPARMSTQILPPERLARYLFSCVLLSSVLGQLGRDGRNLMRSEILEVGEPFEKDQVGSSTMAHKRNPMSFENLEGTFLKSKSELGKVTDTLISEHQRDLVGSSLMRDFPVIVINLLLQLNTLLRKGKDDPRPFLARMVVDEKACRLNFLSAGDKVLAEPFYLALQLKGYAGDAHELINSRAMPLIGPGTTLYQAISTIAAEDDDLGPVWEEVARDFGAMLADPAAYIGSAEKEALAMASAGFSYSKEE